MFWPRWLHYLSLYFIKNIFSNTEKKCFWPRWLHYLSSYFIKNIFSNTEKKCFWPRWLHYLSSYFIKNILSNTEKIFVLNQVHALSKFVYYKNILFFAQVHVLSKIVFYKNILFLNTETYIFRHMCMYYPSSYLQKYFIFGHKKKLTQVHTLSKFVICPTF